MHFQGLKFYCNLVGHVVGLFGFGLKIGEIVHIGINFNRNSKNNNNNLNKII